MLQHLEAAEEFCQDFFSPPVYFFAALKSECDFDILELSTSLSAMKGSIKKTKSILQSKCN